MLIRMTNASAWMDLKMLNNENPHIINALYRIIRRQLIWKYSHNPIANQNQFL